MADDKPKSAEDAVERDPGDPSNSGEKKREAETRTRTRQADRMDTAVKILLFALTLAGFVLGLITGCTGQMIKQATSKPKTSAARSTAPANTSPAPSPTAKGHAGDGRFEVGKQIPAGYYTIDTSDKAVCYWSISSDGTGDNSSILKNANVGGGTHAAVILKKGEWFYSDGCGTWRLS